ncbi:MAG: DNRLRE domain-containing protein [Verrucomicrobiales bacterium]|nr:DNRLRE domain-containing protein [Verrucomicrobiales bacterium]
MRAATASTPRAEGRWRLSVFRQGESFRKRTFNFSAAVTTALFVLGDLPPGRGETIELKPTADTTLFQRSPDNNLGAVDSLAVGGIATGPLARALLKFDVAASLPANAKITSARLAFEVVKVPTSGGRPSDFRLHRFLQAWNEGRKAGGPMGAAATEGESTWNFRVHPTIRWSQPGGGAPVEFPATPSASVRIGGVGRYEMASTSGLVADVQAWLTEPASNFGWILISQAERTPETARRIATREASARGPVLTIEYTTSPSAPLHIDRFEIVANEFRLHFTAEPNQSHQVEFSETLTASGWSTLTNLAPFVMPTDVVVSDGANRPQRFYRLRSP